MIDPSYSDLACVGYPVHRLAKSRRTGEVSVFGAEIGSRGWEKNNLKTDVVILSKDQKTRGPPAAHIRYPGSTGADPVRSVNTRIVTDVHFCLVRPREPPNWSLSSIVLNV